MFMRYGGQGHHRRTVSPHRAVCADTTRQRDARHSARPQRHRVRRRAVAPMARAAHAVRQLAHHLYAQESLVEARGAGSRFAQLPHTQILRVTLEAVALDRTIVTVHPEGTGALKKNRPARHWPVPRRRDDQDSSGCRGCSNGPSGCPVPGPGPRCARGTHAAAPLRAHAAPDPPVDGSGV